MAKRFLNAIRVVCGRVGEEEDFYDDDEREHERRLFDVSENQSGRPFYWTSALQDSFREELEKYVCTQWTFPSYSSTLVQIGYLGFADAEHRSGPRQLHDQVLRKRP